MFSTKPLLIILTLLSFALSDCAKKSSTKSSTSGVTVDNKTTAVIIIEKPSTIFPIEPIKIELIEIEDGYTLKVKNNAGLKVAAVLEDIKICINAKSLGTIASFEDLAIEFYNAKELIRTLKTISVKEINGVSYGCFVTRETDTLFKLRSASGIDNNLYPPEISGEPTTILHYGENYSFAPIVIDRNGDALQFKILNLPSWLTFDPATGALSGVPKVSDVGIYVGILISVSDGVYDYVALTIFSITVLGDEVSQNTDTDTDLDTNTNTTPATPVLSLTQGGLYNPKPIFQVSGVSSGNTVKIYNATSCTNALQNSSTWIMNKTAQGSEVALTPDTDLPQGSYSFMAVQVTASGVVSACSAIVTYTLGNYLTECSDRGNRWNFENSRCVFKPEWCSNVSTFEGELQSVFLRDANSVDVLSQASIDDLGVVWFYRFENEEWLTPIRQAIPANSASRMRVISPTSDIAMMVWEEVNGSDKTMYYSTKSDAFQTRILIENPTLKRDSVLDVALNNTGKGVAVWQKTSAGRTRIYSKSYSSSAWGTAALIENSTTGHALGPKVSINQNTTPKALAVWGLETPTTNPTEIKISANVHSGTVWGTSAVIKTIPKADTSNFALQVKLNDSNQGLAIWEQSIDAVSHIQAAYFNNGVWTATADIAALSPSLGVSGSHHHPLITLNKNSDFVVSWINDTSSLSSQIIYRIFDGQTWSNLQTLSANSQKIDAMSMKMLNVEHDNFQFVWSQGDIWSAVYDGNLLGSPTLLASGQTSVNKIDLNYFPDQNNQGVVAWQSGSGATATIFTKRNFSCNNTAPICGVDEYWNSTNSQCESSRCSTPPTLTNITWASSGYHTYEITGTCVSGTLGTVSPLLCTEATWATPEGSCQVGGHQAFTAVTSAQTFTVPANISQLKVRVSGAAGGKTSNANASKGARVQGTLTVTAGQSLFVYVGEIGKQFWDDTNWVSGAYGVTWNGGGAGYITGGGATDIRSSINDVYADRLLVAGGGAGGGRFGGGWGGQGGCETGANNAMGDGTGGGTQSAGGQGATGTYLGENGIWGVGGAGRTAYDNIYGGGGGGGYYGGGGGGAFGGGGGSSYYSHANFTLATNGCTEGARDGNGEALICWGVDTTCDW